LSIVESEKNGDKDDFCLSCFTIFDIFSFAFNLPTFNVHF
jgi:hypothetical protein